MAAAIRLSQQHSCSFDHLVGAHHQRAGNIVANRFCRLKIDDQLKPGRLLDRKIAGLCAAQELGELPAHGVSKQGNNQRPIADQPALLCHLRPLVHRRQPQRPRAIEDKCATVVDKRRRQHVKAFCTYCFRRVDGAPNFLAIGNRVDSKFDAACACGLFERPKARRRAHIGIRKHRDAADSRHRLDENFLPLAVEFRGKNCDAGGVAIGLGERTHEALVEHVIGESQDWNACSRTLRGANRCISARQDEIHASFHQIGRMVLHSLRQQRETGCIDYEILAFDEAEPPQFIEQREIMRCIARARKQAAEAINAPGLLAARRERPRGRTAEQRYELATLHSITSSARCCRNKGTSRPMAFAVLRLMTSSNFVGCSTGRSAALVPCKNLCTNTALRRYMCGMSAPYDSSPPASAKDRSTEADGRRYLIAKSAMVVAKKMPGTTTASARSLVIAAKAVSTSSSPRTIATGAISMPAVRPASWTCCRRDVVNGSTGLARTATRRNDGSISRNSSRVFPAVSAPILDKPVTLPPGRAKFATRPVPTGSPAIAKIGISRVACFAAKAQGVKIAAMTSTLRRTNSSASPGSRFAFPSAERSSSA